MAMAFTLTKRACYCRKPYNLQLEAMLFGSYSCLGEQEVKLRLYLCDALFKVDDFRQVSHVVRSRAQIMCCDM